MSRSDFYADDLAYVHHTGFADLARGAARFLVDSVHGRVADLGCGSGLLAAPLSDAGCDVIGVDRSRAMLAIARKTAPRARFVRASLYDVDKWFDGAPFHAVLAVGEPLSYGSDSLPTFFRRVARTLRPGGVFVFDMIVAGRPSLSRRTFVSGDDWTTCVATDDQGAKLVRDITTFTRAARGRGSSAWRRSHEVHVVRVVHADDVTAALRRAGFTVRLRNSYGDHPLALRRRAFLCRRR